MSGKRVLALYGALLFCFAAVVCRLYWLCSDTAYGARAAAQSVVTLHLPARRGNFYDHRGQLLTGQTTRWMALCVPGEGSYARLFAYTDAAGQAALYQKRNAASPFLLEVDRDVSALGVSCWPAARRSSAASLAVQLLGYLDGEGHGAAGLEAAFDDLLTGDLADGGFVDLHRQRPGKAAGRARPHPRRQRGRGGAADPFPGDPADRRSRGQRDDAERLHPGAGHRQRQGAGLRQPPRL